MSRFLAAGGNAPIGVLVNRMSVMPEVQGHPIVNQTGLTGKYDRTLTWTPALSAPDAQATDAPSLFEALQQQLGLRGWCPRTPPFPQCELTASPDLRLTNCSVPR